MENRRRFVLGSLGSLGAVAAPGFFARQTKASGRSFNLWAFGDAHVGSDLRKGYKSLADAITQSEVGGAEGGPPFEWDIAVDVGDNSGEDWSPRDPEGEEVVRQFQALSKHKREDVYDICGNIDRNAIGEPEGWWFQKWIDPLGEHTAFSGVNPNKRPYPVTGNWERYSFRVGNILFLMMSDINEPTQKAGRGTLGGNPGGVVSGETFRWWKSMVEANPESIIISAHHYVLKDTTVASGEWEGVSKNADGTWRTHYHMAYPAGTPQGTSYLYWVDSKPDSGAFENFLSEHPGAVDMWLGGHTHTNPDDTYGGKSQIERKWGGVYFLNVSALTKYHTPLTIPLSRLITFTEGSNQVRVQCYMHTSQYAPQGWYQRAERILTLNKSFRWTGT